MSREQVFAVIMRLPVKMRGLYRKLFEVISVISKKSAIRMDIKNLVIIFSENLQLPAKFLYPLIENFDFVFYRITN